MNIMALIYDFDSVYNRRFECFNRKYYKWDICDRLKCNDDVVATKTFIFANTKYIVWYDKTVKKQNASFIVKTRDFNTPIYGSYVITKANETEPMTSSEMENLWEYVEPFDEIYMSF